MVHIFSIQPKQQRMNQITFAPSEAKNWSRNVSRYCLRERYRERAGQRLANFFPVLVTIPEVFAKVNSSHFPSRFKSDELLF